MEEDIRWQQRFSNYRKALLKLTEAIKIIDLKNNDDTENINVKESIVKVLEEGLIQRFEFTHELAWNVMKDFAEFQGNFNIKGSRDASREAFKMKLIQDADSWMDMIKSRNDTTHTYNEETAEEIVGKINEVYYPLFIEFERNMEGLRTGKQEDLFNKDK